MMNLEQYREQIEQGLEQQEHDNVITYDALVDVFDGMEYEEVLQFIEVIRENIEKSKNLLDDYLKMFMKYALKRSDFYQENIEAFRFIKDVIK